MEPDSIGWASSTTLPSHLQDSSDAVRSVSLSRFVRNAVPVPYGLMALVGTTRVRHAHHVDIGHVGIVGFDVALQLADKRAMRLSRVGERLGCACSRHTTNYAQLRGTPLVRGCFSMEPLPRKTSPQELKRLNKFQLPDGCGLGECPLGQEAALDTAGNHQHDQAHREPAELRPGRSFFPG